MEHYFHDFPHLQQPEMSPEILLLRKMKLSMRKVLGWEWDMMLSQVGKAAKVLFFREKPLSPWKYFVQPNLLNLLQVVWG